MKFTGGKLMKTKDKEYVVITALGGDRVGFAGELTTEILSFSGNIEESKMAVLGGEFAMLILVSSDCTDCLDTIITALPEFGDKHGISIQVKKTSAPHNKEARIPYRIETVSLDTQGVINSVAKVLKDYNISIEDLETDISSAPMTGARMFHMRGVLTIPIDVDANVIRERFEELESVQSLEVTLHPLSSTVNG
jgi:glycine cleavage system transcriptional repressor